MKVNVTKGPSQAAPHPQQPKGSGGKKDKMPPQTGAVRKRGADNPKTKAAMLSVCPDHSSYNGGRNLDAELAAALGYNEYTETGRIKYKNPLALGITEWAPDEIPPDSFVICYGKRRTGKSYWTRDFFNMVQGLYWHVNVYTGTKMNGFFQEFVDDKFIIDEYSETGLSNLMEVQKTLKRAKFQKDIPEEAPIHAMVWLDDCISDTDIKHSMPFQKCATAGRHYDLCVGVNTQHVTGVPPVIRVNADIVVIFTQLDATYQKMLADTYLGMLNPRTAQELMDYYTRDHGCIILEPWRNDKNPQQMIHFYKAGEPAPFSVHKEVPQYIDDELKGDIDLSDEEDEELDMEN